MAGIEDLCNKYVCNTFLLHSSLCSTISLGIKLRLIVFNLSWPLAGLAKAKSSGQQFDTIDALREHEKSEQEDKELQNKGL
jgi:ABC-type microcin C transport system permease subunit YejB